MAEVEFPDFEKLDLRVAEIKKIEEIKGADKLYKLTLDVGPEIGERTICAGIKSYYSKDELKDYLKRLLLSFLPLFESKNKAVTILFWIFFHIFF